jgi:transcriptional regulator with XRE-family HTH domain
VEEIKVGKRVKSIRKRKGLTLQELAEKSGVSATAISAIERNVSSPTVTTLAGIARALGESISSLLGETDVSYVITKVDKRETLATGIKSANFQSLASGIPGQRFLPMMSILPPGATSGPDFTSHRGEEFFLVLQGALEVELNGVVSRLEEGDTLYFRSNTPYRWKNVAGRQTQLLIVQTT